MNLKGLIFLFLIIFTGLLSCKTSKPVVSSAGSVLSAANYINTYKDIAVSEMKRTGIPASITLAQGIIESDFGRSRLAREGNNHFGIKCHNDWTGQKIYHNDDKRNECFRKYRKAEESFYDHSDFLKSVSRYHFLFDIDATDYKGWARGLKKSGYATNPDYANMLIRKIEELNLMVFDKEYSLTSKSPEQPLKVNPSSVYNDSINSNKILIQTSRMESVKALVPRIMENNRIQYIIVKDGDTPEKLENEFQLLKWELQKYNELKGDFQIMSGQILYLQPKRDKAEAGKENYTTINGDTMYMIAQKFGIKLKSLYEMNRMAEGAEPEPGKILWLRSLKPQN